MVIFFPIGLSEIPSADRFRLTKPITAPKKENNNMDLALNKQNIAVAISKKIAKLLNNKNRLRFRPINI